jgi:hypothetical protein
VPLRHIRDLLGHADISTTSRYLAVTPTEFQRSIQLAEERYREQTQQRRSGNKLARQLFEEGRKPATRAALCHTAPPTNEYVVHVRHDGKHSSLDSAVLHADNRLDLPATDDCNGRGVVG